MKTNKILENHIDVAYKDQDAYTRGAHHVMWSYQNTQRNYKSENIVFREIMWSENYDDIDLFLRQCEVVEFEVINTSTELMDVVYYFSQNGWKIVGTKLILNKWHDWFTEKVDKHKAITFRRKK